MNDEQINELFKALQGDVSSFTGWKLTNLPALTPQQALTVIYILQERYDLISDVYVMCPNCHYIFSSEIGCKINPDDDDKDEYPIPGIFCDCDCAREYGWRKDSE